MKLYIFHISVRHLYVFFGEVSVQILWPVFNWIVWCSNVLALYTFWILTPCQSCCLQIVSSPMWLVAFLFGYSFLLLCRRFLVLYYPIYFCLYFPCLWCQIHKKFSTIQVHKFGTCFLLCTLLFQMLYLLIYFELFFVQENKL